MGGWGDGGPHSLPNRPSDRDLGGLALGLGGNGGLGAPTEWGWGEMGGRLGATGVGDKED
ncbi:MAG: hypothetical protein ACHBN1_22240 [Heteroscytonema crispum UTEX LB 1556]